MRSSRRRVEVRPWGWARRTLVCLVAAASFTTFHELAHIAAGRSVGLPVVFAGPTDVALSPPVWALVPRWKLALMSGTGPGFSFAMGVAAMAAVTVAGRRMPRAVADLLGWWAAMGVPLLGAELMLIGGPLNDTTQDLSRVAGYLGWPTGLRAVASLAGMAEFLASGLWLGAVLESPLRPGGLRLTCETWRRWLGFGLLGLVCAAAVLGTLEVASGGGDRGVSDLLIGAVVLWPASAALLVPWRDPGASAILRGWMAPCAAAAALLTVYALVAGNQYWYIGPLTVPGLVAAASVHAAPRPSTTRR